MTLSNLDKACALIAKRHFSFSEEFVRDYREFFLKGWGKSLEAIIFYGSCLNEITRQPSSTPDFFLIAGSYFSFHKNIVHTALNWMFTPNTYSLSSGGLRGKYNVITLKDMERETSSRAKDIYNLGRLTKRVAVIYTKDENTKQRIIRAIAGGFFAVASKVLYIMKERFSLDEFIMEALRISYTGERRIEADDKLQRLFTSERDFYRSIYTLALEELIAKGLLVKKDGAFVPADQDSPSFKKGCSDLSCFIWRSRFRAKARWPKSIMTFKGWADTMISKIERTKGIKIKLSEKERRHPLIYGWKYYIMFKRNKMIK